MQDQPLRVGFIMVQVAGHVTFYRDLRSVVQRDTTILPRWNEVYYYRPRSHMEQLHAKLHFLPYHRFGQVREGLGVYQALRGSPYDAILINSQSGAYFTDHFRRIPAIYNTDASPVQLENLDGYGFRKGMGPVAGLGFSMFRRLIHSMRPVTVWSEWAKQSLIVDYVLPAGWVIVTPPGINLDFRQPRARNTQDVSPKRPVHILFVGGEFNRKGGPDLLEWFRQQPTGLCEVHIVTKERVAPHQGVRVYSDLAPDSLVFRQLYQASDIFILPSRGECFGIATVETMATGLPVIVTDVGGTRDIDGVNGYVISPNDMSSMGAALHDLTVLC